MNSTIYDENLGMHLPFLPTSNLVKLDNSRMLGYKLFECRRIPANIQTGRDLDLNKKTK